MYYNYANWLIYEGIVTLDSLTTLYQWISFAQDMLPVYGNLQKLNKEGMTFGPKRMETIPTLPTKLIF